MKEELLRGIVLFKELTDSHVRKFAELTGEKQYESGEIILEQGVSGDALYVVKEGQVIVSRIEESNEIAIVTLEAGEQFGEMSLIEGAPTSARVKADGKITLLMIPREKFLALLNEEDAIAARVYKALAYSLSRRLRSTSADLATWKPSFDF